jgi:hypothetical protein
MSLNNPDSRRALRSVTQAVIMLGFLVLVWLLATGNDTHWLIAVIAISVVGNQIENGVRSFKIGKDGIEADGGGS